MAIKLITRFVLALLVVGTGIYAGLLIAYAIGMYPVLKFMPLRDFAVWWNTHDRVMMPRIESYMHCMWVVWAIAIALVAYLQRWTMLAPLVFALLLSLGESYVYYFQQVPINYHLSTLDTYTVDENVIAAIRSQIFHTLKTRDWLSAASFFFLTMGLSFSGSRLPHLHDHRKQRTI